MPVQRIEGKTKDLRRFERSVETSATATMVNESNQKREGERERVREREREIFYQG